MALKPVRPAALAALPLLVLLSPSGALAQNTALAPGEVITAENRDRIRPWIPDEIEPFVIDDFPDLQMTIVETGDYRPHPKFVEATARFSCQAGLDSDGQIRDYRAGEPFPYSEWAKEATGHACDLRPDDPHFALKLAWNANFRWHGGGINMARWAQSYWRAAGDNTWKIAQGNYRRTYFSNRPDLLPESTELMEGTDVEWAEYSESLYPFDLRGTSFMVLRYRDSVAREDDAWAYVPTLRRVRRISTGQKADSLQGSDGTLEDFFLFSGYVWGEDWRFVREEDLVAAMDTRRSCYPLNVDGYRGDEEGVVGGAKHFNKCRFGPHKALPLIDETWEIRRAVVLEQRPRREGHPYSKKILWYDKETFSPLHFIAYDPKGDPMRLIWYLGDWSETAGRPNTKGRHVNLLSSVGTVNLQHNVSNLMQFFGSAADDFTAREAEKYFDVTRLKRKAH
jgi:hypothetical protein